MSQFLQYPTWNRQIQLCILASFFMTWFRPENIPYRWIISVTNFTCQQRGNRRDLHLIPITIWIKTLHPWLGENCKWPCFVYCLSILLMVDCWQMTSITMEKLCIKDFWISQFKYMNLCARWFFTNYKIQPISPSHQ